MNDVMSRARAVAERREVGLGALRDVLRTALHVDRPDDDLDPDVALFGTGLGLDSVDAIELLVCLEATFGLQLGDDALAPAHMRTLGTVVDLVLASRDADDRGDVR